MTPLSKLEQEIKIQEWQAPLTSAIAPVFLQYFLAKGGLLPDLEQAKQKLAADPDLSEEDNARQSNFLDLEAAMRINNLVAYRTQLLVNVILSSQFPDVYATQPQIPPPAQDSSAGQDHIIQINPGADPVQGPEPTT